MAFGCRCIPASGVWLDRRISPICQGSTNPAGGVMAEEHPELCSRQLHKSEHDVTGPALYCEAAPAGTLQTCVATELADHRRRPRQR